MPLTDELRNKNSPVSKFMRKHFPHARQVLREARHELSKAETILPCGTVPWAIIGMSIDYRIRYYFKVISPKHGNRLPLDDDSRGLMAYSSRWKPRVSLNEEKSKSIRSTRAHNARFSYYPASDIRGDNDDPFFQDDFALGTHRGDHTELVSPLGEFFTALDSITIRLNPVGRRLSAGDEDELNKYCIVLGLLEFSARGRVPEELENANPTDIIALLDIAEHNWIADLRKLSWKFYDGYNDLLRQPSVLNPNFENGHLVGGADADLIAGGTLIEIKTTKTPIIRSNMIWQLLGYALMDRFDKYGIQSIGLYMTRQGVLFQWNLEEIVRRLSTYGLHGLEELRDMFEHEVRPNAQKAGIRTHNTTRRSHPAIAEAVPNLLARQNPERPHALCSPPT